MSLLLLQGVGSVGWVVFVAEAVVFGLAFVAGYTCFFVWVYVVGLSCCWGGGGEETDMLWCFDW